MRRSRALLGAALLGLAIMLVVVLRNDDGPPAAEPERSTRHSIDDPGIGRQAARGAESAEAIGVAGEASDESLAKCTQTLNQAVEFATRERDAAAAGLTREYSEEEWHAEVAKIKRGVAGSRDTEDFLAAILLDLPERGASIDATIQTKVLNLGERAIGSGSKLLAWHALRACEDAKQSCPIAHLEQRLLEADQQNAETWALVATLRYSRGDTAGALAAMQGAARAPTSTWYWTETIALIERTLAAQTDMPYSQRMTVAFGTAASGGLPSQSNLLRMCKVESVASRPWGEACLALGRLRHEHNEAEWAQSSGYSLREQALSALGHRELAAQVAAERAQSTAARSAMVQEPEISMTQLQEVLMETDPQRMHAYLAAIQKDGEVAGRRMFLRQEVPPLLERAGLLEREGARECVAHLFIEADPARDGQQARFADQLHVSMRGLYRRSEVGQSTMFRIRPDGAITLPIFPKAPGPVERLEREIAVAGKTVVQIQQEIATILAEYYQTPEVNVTLFARRSDEELRVEFDNAQKELAGRRRPPR
jgi:hypothetical protein